MTQFHDDDVMVTVTFVAQAFHYDKEVIPVVDSDPCHKCGQPFREQSYSTPSKKSWSNSNSTICNSYT